jgi:hypothetical protein
MSSEQSRQVVEMTNALHAATSTGDLTKASMRGTGPRKHPNGNHVLVADVPKADGFRDASNGRRGFLPRSTIQLVILASKDEGDFEFSDGRK